MATVEERAVGAADSEEAGDGSPKMEELPENKKLKMDDISIPKQNKLEYDSDENDSETDSCDSEEYERWVDLMEATEGFDVDFVPKGIICGFCPIDDLNELTDDQRQECDAFLKKAIEHYNLHENANLELVKLLKVNIHYLSGEMYYFTFEARDAKCGSIGSYQAKVWYAISHLMDKDLMAAEVVMCRKKPGTSVVGQDSMPFSKGECGSCACQGGC